MNDIYLKSEHNKSKTFLKLPKLTQEKTEISKGKPCMLSLIHIQMCIRDRIQIVTIFPLWPSAILNLGKSGNLNKRTGVQKNCPMTKQ